MLKTGETYAAYCVRTTSIRDYPQLPPDVLEDEGFLGLISAHGFLTLARSGDEIADSALKKIREVFNRRAETEEAFKALKEDRDRLCIPHYYL